MLDFIYSGLLNSPTRDLADSAASISAPVRPCDPAGRIRERRKSNRRIGASVQGFWRVGGWENKRVPLVGKCWNRIWQEIQDFSELFRAVKDEKKVA